MYVLTANRILVYRLGHLGDTLIALPSLAAIRKTFPNAHIALLSNYLAPRIRSKRDVRRDLGFFRWAGIKQFMGERGFEALPTRLANGLPSVAHETDHLLRRLSLSGIQVADAG